MFCVIYRRELKKFMILSPSTDMQRHLHGFAWQKRIMELRLFANTAPVSVSNIAEYVSCKHFQYRLHLYLRYDITLPADIQGLFSTSHKTSNCKISQSLETAIFVFRIVRSFRNLTATSGSGLAFCRWNTSVYWPRRFNCWKPVPRENQARHAMIKSW